jgi:hypothetical protein
MARLVSEVATLLYRHDPIGIASGDLDEYRPEAEASSLPWARTVEDVHTRVAQAVWSTWRAATPAET